jgi:transglutaminase-like putative cysteine protease/predicted glutamine amidotransferase
MPNLLAISFEGELAPSFDLRCLRAAGPLPDGWGLGYYPGGEPHAPVLKEPAPTRSSIRGELVRAWQHLESSIFVVHIRRARWGQLTDANTQPFVRSYAGRDWMIAHGGSLRERLELPADAPFLPVGSTDTERVFCELLARIHGAGAQSLGDIPPEVLRGWFIELNERGSMSSVLTDGRDVCVYADRREEGGLYLWQLTPPYGSVVFGDADLSVDLTSRGIKSRKGVIVATEPLQAESDLAPAWRKLAPRSMVLIRQGAIRAELTADPVRTASAAASASRVRVARAEPAPARIYEVSHKTTYRYSIPVERSTHVIRLFPVQDRLQSVFACDVRVSVDGKTTDYDDVFGNRVRRVRLETPFTELEIDALSRVEVKDAAPLSPLHVRSQIPLVWMPWQRHMLQPYLLPPELPESQLEELTEYAMTFVERNDSDVLDTLLDLNATMFKEYRYSQGETTVHTTPFEIYAERRGVCQDFTNLFICLARLLGIPARYVCGYLHTGANAESRAASDASHAWVEVYLPQVGWKGLDPTNGVLVQTDHVRVAVGRSYIDATPTSGTLFVGGGAETLAVTVRVNRVA